jgi:hypothetical protein
MCSSTFHRFVLMNRRHRASFMVCNGKRSKSSSRFPSSSFQRGSQLGGAGGIYPTALGGMSITDTRLRIGFQRLIIVDNPSVSDFGLRESQRGW